MPAYELFSSHRAAGQDGDGADAGRAVHPPLPGRAGAGRRAGRDSRSATSKSAVSRRFVAMTETALAELLAADLSGLDLVALMIDGVHFAEHLLRGRAGHRHRRHQAPAGAGRGLDGEHHRWSPTCWSGCASAAWTSPARSWSSSTAPRRCAAVRRGVRPPGDRSLPAAQDPQRRRPAAATTSRPASAADARRLPRRLRAGGRGRSWWRWPRNSTSTHPGAAASLREGLAETLTVLRLGVPPTLARTLRSTNTIESMISISRDHAAQRQALAGRADGAALVRRRHGSRRFCRPARRPRVPGAR